MPEPSAWLVNRLTSELEHLADYLLEVVGPVGWEHQVRTVLPGYVRQLGELASGGGEKQVAPAAVAVAEAEWHDGAL